MESFGQVTDPSVFNKERCSMDAAWRAEILCSPVHMRVDPVRAWQEHQIKGGTEATRKQRIKTKKADVDVGVDVDEMDADLDVGADWDDWDDDGEE